MTYDHFTDRIVRPALLSSLLVSALLLPIAISRTMVEAQGQNYTPQSFPDWAVNELSRRVTNIENLNVDGRLRVVESDLSELKWMSRSVAIAVIGQFAIAGMGILRRKP